MFDFLKKIFATANTSNGSNIDSDLKAITVYIKCNKCNEAIALRIRKSDEIQRDYDDSGYTFYVQKVVMGSKCYNRIPIRLEMDSAYRIINQTITGGTYIDRTTYDELTKSASEE